MIGYLLAVSFGSPAIMRPAQRSVLATTTRGFASPAFADFAFVDVLATIPAQNRGFNSEVYLEGVEHLYTDSRDGNVRFGSIAVIQVEFSPMSALERIAVIQFEGLGLRQKGPFCFVAPPEAR